MFSKGTNDYLTANIFFLKNLFLIYYYYFHDYSDEEV